jgi:ATP-binding cassette subfamily B (MDR/TAP) protein 1
MHPSSLGAPGPFIQSFAQAPSAGRRILSLIDYPDIPIDVYSNKGIQADENTFGLGSDIVFKDVCFAYPVRPLETVLDSVSLTLKSGTSIGDCWRLWVGKVYDRCVTP